jgi:hypothetical protein
MFEKILVVIGESLSDLASSDDRKDGEDQDDDQPVQGKLRADDKPGGVMGTISKMLQQHMEWVLPKQMKPAELAQPGCWDAADYIRATDKKYSTSKLKVVGIC